jgi:hypothetical protein
MLAASYAAERGLKVIAHIPDFGRFPEAAAVERRDCELVTLADAAVIVWEERNPAILRLLERVKAKGIPVHVIGGEKPAKVKPTGPTAGTGSEARIAGLKGRRLAHPRVSLLCMSVGHERAVRHLEFGVRNRRPSASGRQHDLTRPAPPRIAGGQPQHLRRPMPDPQMQVR